MKKNLLWSLFAATALMTACSQEEMIEIPNQTQPSAEMQAISVAINVGDIATYATESSNGAWTDFKAGQLGALNARAIIQIFDANHPGATPVTDNRVIVKYVAGMSNVVTFEDVRVPANGSYTAVAWVDFIDADASSAAILNDKWYKTADLSKVEVLGSTNNVIALSDTPEGRDAYTGRESFTTTNGAIDIDSNKQLVDATSFLNITAKRPFAKVRVVLTDWTDKASWFNYFSGRSLGADMLVTGLEMKVGANMATQFNAVTGAPVTTGSEGAYTFSRNWATGTDINNFTPASDNNGVSVDNGWNFINDVNFIQVSGGKTKLISGTSDNAASYKEVAVPGVADGIYPILDFQYLIPVSNLDNASYAMTFKAVNQANTANGVNTKTLSTVPVKKNCLTSIFGNFITFGKKFTITVDDEFENQLNSEVVVINDDNTTDYYDTHLMDDGTTLIEVIRDQNDITKIIGINVKYVTAANFDAVVAHINNSDEIHDVIANAVVNLYTKGLPTPTADFKNMTVKEVNVLLQNDIADAVTFTNLKASDFNVKGAFTFANAVTFTGNNVRNFGLYDSNYSGDVTFTGNTNVAKIGVYSGTFAKGLTAAETQGTLALYRGDYKNTVISNINTTVGGQTVFSAQPSAYDRVVAVNANYANTAVYINGATPRTLTVQNNAITAYPNFENNTTAIQGEPKSRPFKAETSDLQTYQGINENRYHTISLDGTYAGTQVATHVHEYFK